MKPILLGLCGHSRAGKDTLARLLAERFRIARVAFADALKREIAAAWHVDVNLFHDDGLKEQSLHQLALRRCTDVRFCADHWHMTTLDSLKPRTVMQEWGDWMNRNDPGRYVRILAAEVRELQESDVQAVLVTDVRLQHEYEWLLRNGGALWRITRPDQSQPSGHETEWRQRHWVVDAEIVNDGSTEQLAKVATDLLLEQIGARA